MKKSIGRKMNMMDVISYANKLIKENSTITAEEMMHNLHCANYKLSDCLSAVKRFFSLSADEAAKLAIHDFKHPLVGKEELVTAMVTIGYQQKDAETAVNAYYPEDTNRYVLKLSSESLVTAPSVSQYNLGRGDFTVEAWICTQKGGTVISRKPTPGCSRNGGFLLVIKADATIKLATDDGFGFYEINSEPINSLFDGSFHHVLGIRRNSELEVYVDFKKVASTVRTNRYAGLNINNSIRLAVGFTDQVQEEYNHFTGKIGEIRIWSMAKTYKDQDEWENTDYVVPGLIGMWSFFEKGKSDYSVVSNEMQIEKAEFVIW